MPAAARGWARLVRWTLPLNLLALVDLSVVQPHDFWWHARVGQIIAATGHVPRVELFSFARKGEPWLNQPWLMQLLLYGLYATGGLALVVFVHALTLTAAYTLVWQACRRTAGDKAATIAAALGAAIGAPNWGVRPQSASFVLFGALTALVEADRAGHRRALWLSPPCFALWANCHGGFTFGLLALGAYVLVRSIEDPTRASRLTLIALASVLALGLTPLGYAGVVEHVAMFVRAGAAGGTNEEFQPLSLMDPYGLIFLYGAGRLVYSLRRTRAPLHWNELVPLLLFAVLTLVARRFSPWFGLLLVGPLGRCLAREPDGARAPVALSRIAATLSVLACLLTLPWLRHRLPLPASRATLAALGTPVHAARWLCQRPGQELRVWSEQAHASYVEWACPRAAVFLDTRTQAFSAPLWDDYLTVESGSADAERVLQRWHPDYAFLDHEELLAARFFRSSPRWREVYTDADAVVFQRVP